MDERLLVKRAKRGDTAAFAELYGTIYKRLYQFALYTLGNTQDAEDVVSAAVMEAFENIGKLRKEDAFSAWMYRIVANMCKQKMREYYQRGEELTEENGTFSISVPIPERDSIDTILILTFAEPIVWEGCKGRENDVYGLADGLKEE